MVVHWPQNQMKPRMGPKMPAPLRSSNMPARRNGMQTAPVDQQTAQNGEEEGVEGTDRAGW